MLNLKLVLALVIAVRVQAFAQMPREISLDNDPFDFTDPVKLVFILIIPLLLIIIGAIWIRNNKKRKKK